MKKQKGITLIALVVTIIVMMILVGITLKIIGDDGIIAKAKWSEFVNEYEKVNEAKEMYTAGNYYIEKYGNNNKRIKNVYQIASSENIPDKTKGFYPVSEKVDINDEIVEETLRRTIAKIEGISQGELENTEKVNLYKVDFEILKIQPKRNYVVNIVSGILYSIEPEIYQGKAWHIPRYGIRVRKTADELDQSINKLNIKEAGTYELIIDAGQIVSWDSITIAYSKYVEGSVTCKAYTSDDEQEWKEITIGTSGLIEDGEEENFPIINADNTKFLKVVIDVVDVNGNSKIDYVLVDFYKFKELPIEPEVIIEGAIEKIDDMYILTTPSNGGELLTGTGKVTQTITVPTDNEEYYIIPEITGNPATSVTITKTDGTEETIPLEDLKNYKLPPGSNVKVEAIIEPGDGIGPIKISIKEKTSVTESMKTPEENEEQEEWKTVKTEKYMYNNGGSGFWEKCLVNGIEVGETGIVMEREDAQKRVKVQYQMSDDGKNWSNPFTNLQNAEDTKYLKVIIEYQVLNNAEYGDLNNNTVKIILNDGIWRVRFIGEDGTELKRSNVYFNQRDKAGDILLPEYPGKLTDKTLAGWEIEGEIKEIGSTYRVTKDIQCYAKMGYEISYDAKGGNGAPDAQVKVQGIELTLSDTEPTKEGHTFKGWSTNVGATSVDYQAGDTFNIDQKMTLYAVWQVNTYTVTYDANNGTGNVPSMQTEEFGETVTVSFSPTPTRSGYEFLGWSTLSNATEATYTSGVNTTFKMVAKDLTLYAVWKATTYTVTYNANNGTGNVPSTQTVSSGATVSVSFSPVPTRSGYTFLGWSTSSTATTATYTSTGTKTFTMGSGNVTLYAVWKDASIVNLVSADNYGDTVNYSVTVNDVVLNNWKIFYNDGNKVIIIYGDYLPNTTNLASNAGLSQGTNRDYKNYAVYSTVSLNDITSKLNDSSKWDSLINNDLKGKAIARGASDFATWAKSWNEKNYLNINYSIDANGYYSANSGTSTLSSTSGIGVSSNAGWNDTLYFPYKKTIENHNVGYRLASNFDSKNNLIIRWTGSITNIRYDYANSGGKIAACIRPIIELSSDVKCEKVNGVWNLK